VYRVIAVLDPKSGARQAKVAGKMLTAGEPV